MWHLLHATHIVKARGSGRRQRRRTEESKPGAQACTLEQVWAKCRGKARSKQASCVPASCFPSPFGQNLLQNACLCFRRAFLRSAALPAPRASSFNYVCGMQQMPHIVSRRRTSCRQRRRTEESTPKAQACILEQVLAKWRGKARRRQATCLLAACFSSAFGPNLLQNACLCCQLPFLRSTALPATRAPT